MRRTIGACVFALSVAAVSPAWAGESGKCVMATQDCLNEMSDKMKAGGWVGVEIDKVEKGDGWLVRRVFPDSPAAASGIQAGDVLYALNGIIMNEANKDAIWKVRKELKPGNKVTYTVKRNNADHDVQITLAPVPADVMARWVGEHMLLHASPVDMAKQEVKQEAPKN